MSHFIIRSNSAIILGTPNGQARTQFEQAMHRGLRAVITRPSALRLMASAGQTSAHVGLWQCIHTTGMVCTDVLRSTYSMWIIEWPLCGSHSAQACSQAWHPMHRCGSTKNSRSVGMTGLVGIHHKGTKVTQRSTEKTGCRVALLCGPLCLCGECLTAAV